jgi:hypothetical protein
MRKEMRSARLLAQRKDDADPDGRRQRAACQPRARAEQHEIQGHQAESGGGVRSGEAMACRLLILSGLEQAHQGAIAAVAHEIPRAIHLGDLLETRNRRRARDQRDQDE